MLQDVELCVIGFSGWLPRHCEGIKAIVAPEISLKSFGTFEKQAPVLFRSTRVCNIVQHLLRNKCCRMVNCVSSALAGGFTRLQWHLEEKIIDI